MTTESVQQGLGADERVATWLEIVLACALITAVCLNVINVVARYIFSRSLDGVDELQIYLLVSLAFFGSVVAAVRRQHLRMDVLTRFFPRSMRRVVDTIEAVLAVLLCGFVCGISSQYALRMRQIGSVSENAHIPMWIPHAVVALAFAGLTLVSLLQLLRRGRTPALDERSALAAQAEQEVVS